MIGFFGGLLVLFLAALASQVDPLLGMVVLFGGGALVISAATYPN